MSVGDMAQVIGYLMGAFALGWCSGATWLWFRKVVETST